MMKDDPLTVCVQNSTEYSIVKLGIEQYDVDPDDIREELRCDIREDIVLMSAALMDFDATMGSYFEDNREQDTGEYDEDECYSGEYDEYQYYACGYKDS